MNIIGLIYSILMKAHETVAASEEQDVWGECSGKEPWNVKFTSSIMAFQTLAFVTGKAAAWITSQRSL